MKDPHDTRKERIEDEMISRAEEVRLSAYAASQHGGLPIFNCIFHSLDFTNLMAGVDECRNQPNPVMLCFEDSQRFLMVVNGAVVFDSF